MSLGGNVSRDERAHLVLPLLRLTPEPLEAAEPPAPVVRLLHLDAPTDQGLAAWVEQVRLAAEPCLVLDATSRVSAMSVACADLLDLDPLRSVGALLLDLVEAVDLSSGEHVQDPQVQVPPLRALATQRQTRGLLRLSGPGGDLTTYDVMAVPLAGGVGVVAFVSEV